VSTLVGTHTASRDGPPTSVTDTITNKIKNPSYTTPRDAAPGRSLHFVHLGHRRL